MADHVPTGRLRRLARLASLGPRAAVAAVQTRLADPEGDRVGRALEETLGELKAGSLKLGQILAQVADDLPVAARARLGRLYGEVAPMPIAAVRGQLAGLPPFGTFEEVPFAAASLGQVHGATIGAAKVAVKVQYPDIELALRADLDLLGRAVGTFTVGGALFDGRAYLLAMREDLLGELDYRAEADRRDQLAAAVARWPDLVVPRVHREFSNARVLTLDRLDGPPLQAWFDGPATAADRARVADQLLRAILGPPLAGLVNADGHPGNFVVLGERLGLLDFGAVRLYAHADGLRSLLLALLDGRPLADPLAAAGFTLELPAGRRERYAQAIAEVLRPLFVGRYDGSAGTVPAGLGALKQRHPRDTLHLRFTPDALALLRALLGLHHALRRLGVPVDIASTVRGLIPERAPRWP